MDLALSAIVKSDRLVKISIKSRKMTKSIVPSLTAQELLDLFRKEANIGVDGSVGFSRKGMARLVGISKTTLLKLLNKIGDTQNLSFELEDFAGLAFEVGTQIPDFLAWGIIQHYAALRNIRCRQINKIIGTIGLRTLVHKSQCWQPDRSPSEQLKYQYLLAQPRKWSSQFPDQYYEHLARLTNIYPIGTNRPHRWAQLTNELVYAYLPKEIEDGVRQAKLVNAASDKLHQFLKPDGLDLSKNHLNALMILMSGASSIEELRKASIGRFAGKYQLGLQLAG